MGLLRAAIRQYASDRRSRLRLIDKIAYQLRYALHELPSGVLYGLDGASPEQCLQLEEELEEFCRFLSCEKMEERYAELVRDGRMHFRAYREYLLDQGHYHSYAAYLARKERSMQ